MFCHSCGSKLQLSGQAFCQNCGTQQLNDQPVQDSSGSSSAEAILKLLNESESVTFQANAKDPFYTSVHPFMFVYSMASEGFDSLGDYIDGMWGDSEEATCDNCKVDFFDLNNWVLDDGSNVFGFFCPQCISNLLNGRELFLEQISANEYAAWTKLSPRPDAVCWIRDHYESAAHVTGNSNELKECWSCAYTGTKVNLAVPHWEVTLGHGSSNSMLLPVCDDCIRACRILIPRA